MLAFLKHQVKCLVSAEYKKNSRELRRLKKIPRYTRTESSLLGNQLIIPDTASFIYQYEEFFINEIYKFRCKTATPFIIDCGANIGLSCIYMKKLFPLSEIIAFEPDPGIFSILKKNIENFQISGVTLVNKALWDKETTLAFLSDGADGGRVTGEPGMGRKNGAEVQAEKLSPYLDRNVDFLKIDIEGAELKVLTECRGLLRNVQRLFVEYHSSLKETQEMEKVLEILHNSGFRTYLYTSGKPVSSPFIYSAEGNGEYNYLCNIFAYKEDHAK